MKRSCQVCVDKASECTVHGHFVRRSDGRRLLRYRCKNCFKTFSDATTQDCYRQKKRRLNPRVYELLCSGVSQRRIARLLKISRTTVERKFVFLAIRSRIENLQMVRRFKLSEEIQFDDLETIEHTKCKPLSVAMAVDKKSRRILSFSVSRMPAKGHLAKISRKKYGFRPDERMLGWNKMFSELRELVPKGTVIRSDENPHYVNLVRKWHPGCHHETVRGQRGAVTGQGELKKIKFDPLFTLNHTFAMCRANINRLFRKTWCTTKRRDRLAAHIELYMNYHNKYLVA